MQKNPFYTFNITMQPKISTQKKEETRCLFGKDQANS